MLQMPIVTMSRWQIFQQPANISAWTFSPHIYTYTHMHQVYVICYAILYLYAVLFILYYIILSYTLELRWVIQSSHFPENKFLVPCI